MIKVSKSMRREMRYEEGRGGSFAFVFLLFFLLELWGADDAG